MLWYYIKARTGKHVFPSLNTVLWKLLSIHKCGVVHWIWPKSCTVSQNHNISECMYCSPWLSVWLTDRYLLPYERFCAHKMKLYLLVAHLCCVTCAFCIPHIGRHANEKRKKWAFFSIRRRLPLWAPHQKLNEKRNYGMERSL